MEFRILGSLEAEVNGVPVGLSGPAERKVLAVLLLEAGRMVPVSRLIDARAVG
jgi:DNA-binding SARP family transcriptional activator